MHVSSIAHAPILYVGENLFVRRSPILLHKRQFELLIECLHICDHVTGECAPNPWHTTTTRAWLATVDMTQRTHFVAAGLVHRNVEAQHKCHQPKYEHEDLPASHTLPPHGVDGDLCAHVLNGKTRI